MTKIFFMTLLAASVPISILNSIATRDTDAVAHSERAKLTAAFDAAHTLELVPQFAADPIQSPSRAMQVALQRQHHPYIAVRYAFSGNAKTPLVVENAAVLKDLSPDVAAFYTTEQSLKTIYEAACRRIATYRPTPPLFGTSLAVIRHTHTTDTAMYRALMDCPRRYQDMRINKP